MLGSLLERSLVSPRRTVLPIIEVNDDLGPALARADKAPDAGCGDIGPSGLPPRHRCEPRHRARTMLVFRAVALWLLACVAAVLIREDGTVLARTNSARASRAASHQASPITPPASDRTLVETAYRANNIGVAWLERFDYEKAAAQFHDALRLQPSLGLAHFNLALALFYDNSPDAADREARLAARLMPSSPYPQHLLGLIARTENRPADAAAAFTRVLQMDAGDVGANVGLGQVRLQQGDARGAVAAFERALGADPFNATAAYNLSLALTRAGRADEGRQMLARFQTLRESGAATTLGNGYLQQGRYGEALVSTGAEPDLVSPGTPDVQFLEEISGGPRGRAGDTARASATARKSLADAIGGGLTAIDVDDDGDLDLLEIAPDHERFWRNDGRGRFRATTAPAFAARPRGAMGIAAVAGDVDNDGRTDLLVLRYHGTALYRNGGGGRFTDITATARLRLGDDLPVSAALLDADHDGDLDVLVAGFVSVAGHDAGTGATGAQRFPEDYPAAPTRLFRNDGNGRFSDVSKASGLGAVRVVGVVPTDYDERRDVDILAVPENGRLSLFRNGRDGSFADAAHAAGLVDPARWSAVSAGDLNKDGRTDFYLGRSDGPGLFVLSAGVGRFRTEPAPGATAGTRASQLIDYDNDGLLDLLVFTTSGVRLLRNVGSGWLDVSAHALPPSRDQVVVAPIAGGRAVLAADLDGDGDTDLVMLREGALRLWRNQGGNRQSSLAVRLAGRVSNRSAAGTKIELRAGSLREWRESTAVTPPVAPADLLFGLGTRRHVDAIRLLWPSGVLQAELPPAEHTGPLRITELDRKPSSCPFLFTWSGRAFEFITDFLGGGELGYWVAPGVRGQPDPDEYVRIAGDRLRPRDGRYEIRITNELEEVLFLDTVRLHVFEHPDTVEVYPDEGLIAEPRSGLRLHVVGDLRLPDAVTDDAGHDVRQLVARQDFRAPDQFALSPIRGYAASHSLTIVRGSDMPADRLLLTGWTDYAYSSDNVAASQSGLHLSPPMLQVRTADGRWITTDAEIGVPAGRPQTVVVNLQRYGLAHHREFRLVTNMRIYWDQIRFAHAADESLLAHVVLEPLDAALRWRGFSREWKGGAGGPSLYAYGDVSSVSPWKRLIGAYTGEGPVRGMLEARDDRFVIAGSGDEIAVAFDASRDGPSPPGRTRTFLLHADGFSKEMDLHSASPDTVLPLPFHGMGGYPPAARHPAGAPDDSGLAPSRVVVRPVPGIDTLLIAERHGAPPARRRTPSPGR